MGTVALLGACQTLPTSSKRPPTQGSVQREQQLNRLLTWRVKGALGIQSAQEGWTATFNWAQHGKAYQLQFFGPLGAGTFHIAGEPGKVTLTASGETNITAADPDTLLFRASGWRVPVSNIFYWVRGLPAPGPYSTYQLDGENHLHCLKQQGWTVYFERYQTVNGFTLPAKLVLERPPTTIRILLKGWEL